MAKRTRSSRGRPKGSRNREYQTVDQIPAQCTKCYSTKLRIVDGNKPIIRELSGLMRDGARYTRVRWDRKKCMDCGQLIAVRTYFQN